MARLVLGLASSHAPQLEMPPETWRTYGDIGRARDAHWYQGKPYSFSELADLRAADHFEKECTEGKFRTRFDACQTAIGHLCQTLKKVKPDVCLILGDDQHEAFHDDIMPSLAIYCGDSVADGMRPSRHRATLSDPAFANVPDGRPTYPAHPSFAQHLIEAMVENEFDVARSNKLPNPRDEGSIGHAFYYVYRRLMGNDVGAHVPIMINTYYPPNVPTPSRCYKFGQALGRAIEAWAADQRVAVIASGGLSHKVIEEDLDTRIIKGLKNRDAELLTDFPDVRFRDGSSEIKNWITLGGVMAARGLDFRLVDYVPCYRTEAGNGCGMGFAEWL